MILEGKISGTLGMLHYVTKAHDQSPCVTLKNITQWLIPFPLEQRSHREKKSGLPKQRGEGTVYLNASSTPISAFLIQAAFYLALVFPSQPSPVSKAFVLYVDCNT